MLTETHDDTGATVTCEYEGRSWALRVERPAGTSDAQYDQALRMARRAACQSLAAMKATGTSDMNEAAGKLAQADGATLLRYSRLVIELLDGHRPPS